MSWGPPGVLQEQGSAEHQLRCRCVQGAWQPGDNLQEGLGGGREAGSRSGDSLEKHHCGEMGRSGRGLCFHQTLLSTVPMPKTTLWPLGFRRGPQQPAAGVCKAELPLREMKEPLADVGPR